MRSVGMSRTEQPEYGDVGLIKTDGAGENAVAGAAVCIFDSRWWVAKELDGISYHDAKPLIAWHVA